MNFYGEMPASYTINVNVDHPLVDKILKEEAEAVPAAEVVADAAEGASDEEKKAVQEKKDAAAATHKEAVEAYAKGNDLLAQLCDLALLASGMLKGKALSDFIARSRKVVEDAYLKA